MPRRVTDHRSGTRKVAGTLRVPSAGCLSVECNNLAAGRHVQQGGTSGRHSESACYLPGCERLLASLRRSRLRVRQSRQESPPTAASLTRSVRSTRRALRHLPDGHPQHVAEALVGRQHGRRLEAAMHQAVLAARIAAGAEPAPVGRSRPARGRCRNGRRPADSRGRASRGRCRSGSPRRHSPIRAGRAETPCRSARPSAGTARNERPGGAELLVHLVARHEDAPARPADRPRTPPRSRRPAKS